MVIENQQTVPKRSDTNGFTHNEYAVVLFQSLHHPRIE